MTQLNILTTLFHLITINTAFQPLSTFNPPPNPYSLKISSNYIDIHSIKNGQTITVNNKPYKITHFSIMKQARSQAKTTIQFKNLLPPYETCEKTYRSNENLVLAVMDYKKCHYSYTSEQNHHFIELKYYEEITIPINKNKNDMKTNIMKESSRWLMGGMDVTLIFFQEELVNCVLPDHYMYEICDILGEIDDSTNRVLLNECGQEILVPVVCDIGDTVKVEVPSGQYVERMEKRKKL